MAPLLRSALECLLHERDLPPNVGAMVDTEFTGGATTRPLHARLRLIFHEENEREEHYCVRALQLTNARAYQARLKAAMTQSGIDRTLRFRRLAIVRTTAFPGGGETQKLTEKFTKSGGIFLQPTEEELRTLHAIHELKKLGDADFDEWLKARQPISKLKLVQQIAPSEFFSARPADPPDTPRARGDKGGDRAIQPGGTPAVSPPATSTDEQQEPAPAREGIAADAVLPLGRRIIGNNPGQVFGLAPRLLEKHTLVLAGAGSGKTVLLKRLVEESLLLGIPSIVIDCANDLATLDEEWAPRPAEWRDEDQEKAGRYHRRRDVILWTPGKEAGNPLSFEPLPDLAPLSRDEDELESAVAMVRESLAPIVAPGRAQASQQKLGILTKSLRYLAQNGGGRLPELIGLLGDLPPDAGLGVANESRLAQQIADALKVEMETNPLLRSQGTAIDPAVLLGDGGPPDRVRISVINLVGLPGTGGAAVLPQPVGDDPLRLDQEESRHRRATAPRAARDRRGEGLRAVAEGLVLPGEPGAARRAGAEISSGAGLRHAEPEGHRPPDRGELLDAFLRQGQLPGRHRDRSGPDPVEGGLRRRRAQAAPRAVLRPQRGCPDPLARQVARPPLPVPASERPARRDRPSLRRRLRPGSGFGDPRLARRSAAPGLDELVQIA